MGVGLKKDIRVFRVGSRGSFNALFSLSELLFHEILVMVRKNGGISTLGESSMRVVYCVREE